MNEPENMTVYELMVFIDENFDSIADVWTEMVKTEPGTTLAKAAVEWAHRDGREIIIVPKKSSGMMTSQAVDVVKLYG